MSSNKIPKSLLIIGNFLSQELGSHGVCEHLAINLRENGWRVYTTSSRLKRIPRLLDMLWTILWYRKRYKIAQVDVYSGLAFIWAEIACWTLNHLGKPFILTLHGGNLLGFDNKWPGRVKHLLNSAVAVTAPSNYLSEVFGDYRSDIRVIPNPVELARYPFRSRGVPRPKLIWMRAFHHLYNPPLAIHVLTSLFSLYPGSSLLMLGPDKGDGSFQEVKQLVNELNLNGRVQYTGGVPKSDVPSWLNKGDIFLNTTNVDNTPVTVVEAMACGLCVVSTDVGGVPYLLEDGKDALLVPPGDPQAMTAAICRLLTEPGLGETLSTNARRKAERCDWTVILPQWEALFQEVIEIHAAVD